MTAHPLGLLFVCLIVVFVAVAILWNLIPSWRNFMKGYSTLAEGAFGIFMSIFGEVAGGIQDAQVAGYIPPQIATYIPFAVFLYIILKRVVTTTPVGQK